jgi:hypothetical protein
VLREADRRSRQEPFLEKARGITSMDSTLNPEGARSFRSGLVAEPST